MKVSAFLFTLLSLAAIPLYAEETERLEYFIDSDPGVGSAIPLEAIEGINSYTLPLEGVAPGAHIFGIRATDSRERWTRTVTHPLYIADEMLYADLEYYIDNDPGQGKGEHIDHGQSRIVNFNVPTKDIAMGTHTLSVRVLDPQGQWRDVMTRPFLVTEKIPETDLILEYFYDSDPGVGLAKRVAVGEGDNVFYLPIEKDMAAGAHIFGVRVMDKDERWTRTVTHPLYLMDRLNLTEAEYFVDNDPGEGKANHVAIDESGTSAFTIPTSDLTLGTHTLTLRARDNENADNISGGEWMEIFARPFEVRAKESGVAEVAWKMGFNTVRSADVLTLYAEDIPSGSRVSVISLSGIPIAESDWSDTSTPLSLTLPSSEIVIVRIVSPQGELSVKTVR